MNNSIPVALQSPRVDINGQIHWYEGDTFTLKFDIKFVDITGKEIPIQPTDVITIVFKNMYQGIVQEFQVIGTNQIEMLFNEEVSNKFKQGRYKYTAKLNNGWIKTFMKDNVIVVE